MRVRTYIGRERKANVVLTFEELQDNSEMNIQLNPLEVNLGLGKRLLSSKGFNISSSSSLPWGTNFRGIP